MNYKSTIANHLALGVLYQHLPYQVSFYKLTAYSSSWIPPSSQTFLRKDFNSSDLYILATQIYERN
jgi:hypothetical protein